MSSMHHFLPATALDQCWTRHQSDDAMSSDTPIPVYYYFNHLSGKCQWERPASFVEPLSDAHVDATVLVMEDLPQTLSIKLKLPLIENSWHLVKLSNEEFFFYDEGSGISQWMVPEQVKRLFMQTRDIHLGNGEQRQYHGQCLEESDADRHEIVARPPPPKQKLTPHEKFRKLLEESNITKFTVWSAIEPQMKKDSRFHALKPKERKILFMKYIREKQKS